MTEAFGAMVRKEIDDAWRGRTGRDLHGVPDAVLCMELIARGWVVYKPAPPKD